MGDEAKKDHVRIVVNRREVAALAREHRRVFVEWSDRNGVRCCTTGFIANLDALVLTVEAAGRGTSIHLDRIHTFEPVGGKRPADASEGEPT